MVLSQGDFCPPGIKAIPGAIFGCHNLGLGGCYGPLVGEVKDATKHPIRHRTVPCPTIRTHPA